MRDIFNNEKVVDDAIYKNFTLFYFFTFDFDKNSKDIILYHDCLRIAISFKTENAPYEILSFCMSEWPSKWNIEENMYDKKFPFYELYKQHITSQQIYLWSASMDIAEQYQLYLNQILITNETLLTTQVSYNCTQSRFGSICQYSFDYYQPYYS
ncbi:unnamed protein product [Adineta steineri]|uniref:Uncharacterized protein n=1 Tax=Adineta steineri TaxID=433720 RepID=A0A818HUP6_9BILA|nr:unnamed protein product [Adineta steineri]